MIAHQYKIREEKRLAEKDNITFDPSNLKLANSEIRIINKQIAKNLIIEYEWLKSIPQFTKYHFGIYFNINGEEYLGGVLIFSGDYAQNTGVWDKYGFGDKLILLSRGVCLWWTPKNTASFFISKAINWIKTNTHYRIVTATVDPMAGEIGTIYQSLNWKYVGLMSGNYNNKKETKRFSVLINGKLRYSRSIRKELGTMKRDVILEKYPDAIFIPQYRKRRYFYFFDTKINNKILIKNISHLILPYPKRNNDIVGQIYKITNSINNKIYIGQTTRPFKDRINDYRRGICNDHIKNSFNKHGFNNFKFEIIDTAETIDELNNKEIMYITKYDSTNKNIGYNLELGGRNSIPSPETLLKMSESHLGIIQSETWINKRIAVAGSDDAKKYGKTKSDIEKKHLSEKSPKFWLGKNRSEETKEKIRQTKKENGLSDTFKKKICKQVLKIDSVTNEIITIYESTADAGNQNNISQSTISRKCSGKSKNSGPIHWRYK